MTPFEKLKALACVSDVIKSEIKDFWKGVDVRKDKLVLDGDKFMMLFVYIVAKADVKNIIA